jgi:hypothetical protein
MVILNIPGSFLCSTVFCAYVVLVATAITICAVHNACGDVHVWQPCEPQRAAGLELVQHGKDGETLVILIMFTDLEIITTIITVVDRLIQI